MRVRAGGGKKNCLQPVYGSGLATKSVTQMSSFRTAINFFSSSLTGYKGFKKLCKYILFSIFYTAFSNTFRQTMDVENLTMFMFIRLAMTYTPSLGVVSEEWDNNSILDEYLYVSCYFQYRSINGSGHKKSIPLLSLHIYSSYSPSPPV